jgi:hypothetical protein
VLRCVFAELCCFTNRLWLSDLMLSVHVTKGKSVKFGCLSHKVLFIIRIKAMLYFTIFFIYKVNKNLSNKHIKHYIIYIQTSTAQHSTAQRSTWGLCESVLVECRVHYSCTSTPSADSSRSLSQGEHFKHGFVFYSGIFGNTRVWTILRAAPNIQGKRKPRCRRGGAAGCALREGRVLGDGPSQRQRQRQRQRKSPAPSCSPSPSPAG